jgi:hypothetical protein
MNNQPEIERYLDGVQAKLWLLPRRYRLEVREELRNHLESLAADYECAGFGSAKAIQAAFKQFGKPAFIGHRLAYQWFKENLMKPHRVVSFVVSSLVILSAAWLVFSSYMVFYVALKPGAFVVWGGDGAKFEMRNGAATVMSDGVSGGVAVLHTPLVPALVIPFLVIFTLAVYGCVQLLRRNGSSSSPS